MGTVCIAHATPDIVLRGAVSGGQNQSYIETPVDVPDRVERLTVVFHYTGRKEGTLTEVPRPVQRRMRWIGEYIENPLSRMDQY